MSPPKRPPIENLRFLLDRFSRAGFDSDYIDKLSPAELKWFEEFIRRFYDGATEPDPSLRTEIHHHRYMMENDAAIDAKSLEVDPAPTETFDPERQLLLAEEIATRTRRKKKSK